MITNDIRMKSEVSVACGGMADIFLGEKISTRSVVALKIPRPGVVKNKEGNNLKVWLETALSFEETNIFFTGRIYGSDGLVAAET